MGRGLLLCEVQRSAGVKWMTRAFCFLEVLTCCSREGRSWQRPIYPNRLRDRAESDRHIPLAENRRLSPASPECGARSRDPTFLSNIRSQQPVCSDGLLLRGCVQETWFPHVVVKRKARPSVRRKADQRVKDALKTAQNCAKPV